MEFPNFGKGTNVAEMEIAMVLCLLREASNMTGASQENDTGLCRLSCANPVRGSSCESSVIAGWDGMC